MTTQEPIYAGTKGLSIKIALNNVTSLNGAINCKFFVMIPGATTEIEWAATPIINTNILEVVTQESEPLREGIYLIHPYFELGVFKGRWSPSSIVVWPLWKKPK